jgi:hypothetical protein
MVYPKLPDTVYDETNDNNCSLKRRSLLYRITKLPYNCPRRQKSAPFPVHAPSGPTQNFWLRARKLCGMWEVSSSNAPMWYLLMLACWHEHLVIVRHSAGEQRVYTVSELNYTCSHRYPIPPSRRQMLYEATSSCSLTKMAVRVLKSLETVEIFYKTTAIQWIY